MKEKKNMTPVVVIIIASVLLLLAGLLVGIGGLVDWIPAGNGELPYGVRASIDVYGSVFVGDFSSKWSFVVLFVDTVVLIGLIASIVLMIRKKHPQVIYCAVAISLGIAYLPYLGILVQRLTVSCHADVGNLWLILISFWLDLIGILLMSVGSYILIKAKKEAEAQPAAQQEALSEDQVRTLAREEIENYEASKQPAGALSEEDVNKIADDVSNKVAKTVAEDVSNNALREHVAEFHAQQEETPLPKEEEPVVEMKPESKEEQPVVETKTAEVQKDPFAALRNKRRASFETRLKNADFDLRHKYYDLRDHIKSYGLNNRLSIPGDTFSAHRKRYVFMTINGKHLRVYFAVNPDEYKDTPIPVERTETKKYEDLPLQFKVRSDLSFRRAIKIIDDMLTKEGYTREDKPVKNTQNPEGK